MAGDPILERQSKLLEAFDFSGVLADQEREYEERTRSLLLSILEVMDSFDRFFAHVGDAGRVKPSQASNWLNTVRLIQRQLELVLQRAEVTPIVSLGKVTDPDVHEIVGTKETNKTPEGVIAEEVRRGYEWRGKLLRSPRVVIAKKPKEGQP